MVKDVHYLDYRFKPSELEHKYGKQVHILSDPFLFTTLARLCETSCTQPLINMLLDKLYRDMVKTVMNVEFPTVETTIETRMSAMHPEGKFLGRVIDPKTSVVCVNLARAGTVPSHICYDAFNYMLEPQGVRQDHISINRKIDDHEKVIGANLGGVKIGGDIDNRFVIIPDPMGATGSTIDTSMAVYADKGKPKKVIAMHLIVTPEYLTRVTKKYPDLAIYAIRIDRGLSDAGVLSTQGGTRWAEEKGLNPKQYIVPGAGGLGEVINNSYV